MKMRAEVKELHQRLGVTSIFVTHDQEEAMSISDRIAVMHKGRIEQLGTPEEIYGRPANLHVARFMGYRNVLPFTLTGERGSHLALSAGGVTLTGVAMGDANGTDVSVALRPEDFERAAPGDPNAFGSRGPHVTFVAGGKSATRAEYLTAPQCLQQEVPPALLRPTCGRSSTDGRAQSRRAPAELVSYPHFDFTSNLVT